MSKTNKKISRRQFIHACMQYAGVAALSISGLDVFAADKKNIAMNNPADIWKWNTPAHYYTKTEKGIVCGLCPNACLIPLNGKGMCSTRVNFKNELYAINYGNPCSINSDPIEKKPLYHFLPQTTAFSLATAGCNYTCLNCQNWQISQVSPFDTKNYDLFPKDVVAYAQKNKCKSIAYTYTEPVVFYEYVYDTAQLAHQEGLKNLFISNGSINEAPLRKLCKYLDAANINLKSFKDDIYRKLNGGKLATVKKSLKIFKEEGVWLEITNLIVPGWTDDLEMIKEMCDWLYNEGFADCPLHFSRFFPTYKLTQLPATPIDILNKAHDIALAAGIRHVYIGNVPGTEYDDTYCPKCKKKIIERRGYTILSNNIKDGKCGFCNEKINGVWK
ncbi:MAG TPA: AmmeMemoRadiSam system radical SAM enzyme [Bacteroidales bacterium]|nr:AmmeMemoRadiSam system radical SAM enzyme [Bacteroidales bacterium]